MDAPHPELEPVFHAIREGRMDRALELARALAESAEGDLAIEARRHVGLTFFHLGDYGSAVPNFLEVARAKGDRQSWFVLSLARTLAGDPVGGGRDFERALGAPAPGVGPDGRPELTEHFMRFDYMHVLVDSWNWDLALQQLEALTASIRGLARHDDAFLLGKGIPALTDILEGGLRVYERVPDSDPIAWLTGLRRDLSQPARVKVDQAISVLARKLGPPGMQ
ncbi:MAG: hypothetical protein H6742_21365 [Alphaproteobacteria bacterium]|nr:hypothetical protein [Alphaproteobacteria bacterium]